MKELWAAAADDRCGRLSKTVGVSRGKKRRNKRAKVPGSIARERKGLNRREQAGLNDKAETALSFVRRTGRPTQMAHPTDRKTPGYKVAVVAACRLASGVDKRR